MSLLTWLRRFLVLTALLFWQGGFLFYAAVVVPVGQRQFGDVEQGFITRQVTNYLNLAGAVALLPLAWDLLASTDSSVRRRQLRWATWILMAATLVMLARLHVVMDELLDVEYRDIVDRRTFRLEHRAYLWISTLQWGCGVLYSVVMLRAWAQEDREKKKPLAA